MTEIQRRGDVSPFDAIRRTDENGEHWIYRQGIDQRWRVYQTQIDAGRLTELTSSHYHPRTGELVLDAPQVRVTVKGLGALHRHLGGSAALAITSGQESL